jgi:putative FmdB family regulatory protein
MALYNLSCEKCGLIFDELCTWEELAKVRCQKCKSKKINKNPTCPTVVFTDPLGTSKMENFGYRAGYYMNKATTERRNAEAKSHMGTTPFGNVPD